MPKSFFRESGIIEAICDHGVGHPVGHTRGFLKEVETIHGCDGCCKDYKTQLVADSKSQLKRMEAQKERK